MLKHKHAALTQSELLNVFPLSLRPGHNLNKAKVILKFRKYIYYISFWK